jgi:hypothetical protein
MADLRTIACHHVPRRAKLVEALVKLLIGAENDWA